ncbi:MAG TPA: 50S ribosomal protein L29 [Candidatus Magasanikbacteria bacterium]|jgi:ribosomal protein L29|nr:50S ribosomal protein L29 [Candidatus Magasanikbacteria bacterium]HQF57091.1 50S ribosomal protein L29 [Candidatus Magasanikbacteria bacterium]HQL52869.1 50S ribosomal protein L29 [Candidatus Magasanikbacteria bacterium]
MDFKDLKNKNERDLHELLSEKRNELREMKFKISGKQMKNLSEVKKNKKIVARILTLLNQKKEEQTNK